MTINTVMKCNYKSNHEYKIALLDKWSFKYPCLIDFRKEQKRTYGTNYWD